MSTDEFDPRQLLAESGLGILATLHEDGRPQLSPVTPHYDRSSDTILVSSREGLVKTANLRRDPRAVLNVTSDDGWSWASAEGVAHLIGPGSTPDDPAVEALVAYYRAAAGEHPDWQEYRDTMVADRRVLLTIRVMHVYGARLGGD